MGIAHANIGWCPAQPVAGDPFDIAFYEAMAAVAPLRKVLRNRDGCSFAILGNSIYAVVSMNTDNGNFYRRYLEYEIPYAYALMFFARDGFVELQPEAFP